jgi:hypothetical protein
MASFLNASIMSNVGQMMAMGQDVMKYARQAVKGMGQDARFFRDSKKGEDENGRAREEAGGRRLTRMTPSFPTAQARSASCARSSSLRTWTS